MGFFKNLIHNKYGFTPKDYENLSEDRELDYFSLSRENRLKFIDCYIDNHPNLENVKYFKNIIKESIIDHGFNSVKPILPSELDNNYNPFLIFVNNAPAPIYLDVAENIKYFIESGELDPDADWLYKKELYEGSSAEIVMKVKAFVYASNDSLQVNALKNITIYDLMDENGKILSYKEIHDILKNI